MGRAQGKRVGHPHREAVYIYSSHRAEYVKSETVHAPCPKLTGSYCIYRMNKNSLSAVGEYKEISNVHEQLDNLTLFSLHQLAAALSHLQVLRKELICSV